MENGDKRIQYQKVKMVPYLDKSGIFLLAFPACECEWAHIVTTHISKCTLVCMSPWHSITGSHTCLLYKPTFPRPPLCCILTLASTTSCPGPHPWPSSLWCWSCLIHGKCLSSIFHCLTGIPRRAPYALRWGVLSDFTSMPPSPKNHTDQEARIWGRL